MDKNKKARNPVYDDNKCFHFAATITINYEETGKHPERISKIKPCMNKYNWKGINSSSGNDLGKLKKKTPTVALNKFYATNEYSYSKHLKS